MDLLVGERIRFYRNRGEPRALRGTIIKSSYWDAGWIGEEVPRCDLFVDVDGIGERKAVDLGDLGYAFSAPSLGYLGGGWRVVRAEGGE